MKVILPVTLSLGILLLRSRVCVLEGGRGGEGRGRGGEREVEYGSGGYVCTEMETSAYVHKGWGGGGR